MTRPVEAVFAFTPCAVHPEEFALASSGYSLWRRSGGRVQVLGESLVTLGQHAQIGYGLRIFQ